ncbi:MAG TPA: type IV pilus twitching motility protein PilT [Desulfuromonadales bacterium]|nr:type IV pilus twitching motility protein PilT [Desulfuromonadales bacterium]
MPVIDRYLEAMQKQRAESLLFIPEKNVEMTSGGASRPVSNRPATVEQISQLVAEVIPDYQERASAGPVSHAYSSPFGQYTFQLKQAPEGLVLRIVPNTSTGQLPQPQAASVPALPAAAPPENGSIPAHLDELFHQMLDMKASDLHLKSGKAPMIRVDGSMTFLPGRGIIPEELLYELLRVIIPEKNQQEYAATHDTDFAYELGERSRMRANVFRDIAGIGAVFRQIPTKILTAQQLGLPKAVLEFCEFDKGLVVVTGPTGSGKSTTLAAMIDYINDTREDHLITIEDPVEFVHRDKQCHINQREVGTHTKGFKQALRAALREDPDIVLVGEMRDLETVAIAIETAETGHLVFGTLHTNTAPSTIDRLIDQFPADRQQQVRTMLSESLKGVVAQTLLKKKGGGRVAALEILVVTNAVSNLIREGKTFQIPSIMQTGKNIGMQTLNDALIELVKSDTVEPQEAYDRAPQKKEFGMMLARSGFKGPWCDEKASQ